MRIFLFGLFWFIFLVKEFFSNYKEIKKNILNYEYDNTTISLDNINSTFENVKC